MQYSILMSILSVVLLGLCVGTLLKVASHRSARAHMLLEMENYTPLNTQDSQEDIQIARRWDKLQKNVKKIEFSFYAIFLFITWFDG